MKKYEKVRELQQKGYKVFDTKGSSCSAWHKFNETEIFYGTFESVYKAIKKQEKLNKNNYDKRRS